MANEKPHDDLFGNDDDFYLDPYGQLTLKETTSPLGRDCEEAIKAQNDLDDAKDHHDKCFAVVLETMQERGLKRIKVLGRTFVLREAKLTDPKVVMKEENGGV